MRAPRLLAISHRKNLPAGEFAEWLRKVVMAGIDTIQIREKDLSDRQLMDLARSARETAPPPTRLLINGRIDIALGAEADGVHLPSTGVPPEILRRRFGSEPVLGVSTHRLGEVERARIGGADYVTFGPIYPTPGKERYGPPAGLDGLAAAAGLGIPVVALGGITIERLADTAEAGAVGAAGIRMFQTDGLDRAVRVATCFEAARLRLTE